MGKSSGSKVKPGPLEKQQAAQLAAMEELFAPIRAWMAQQGMASLQGGRDPFSQQPNPQMEKAYLDHIGVLRGLQGGYGQAYGNLGNLGMDLLMRALNGGNAPQAPGQMNMPRAPGQINFPRAPGQINMPRAPGQINFPQAPGQINMPRAPGQINFPQAPGQINMPRAPGQMPIPQAPGPMNMPRAPGPMDMPQAPSLGGFQNQSDQLIGPLLGARNQIIGAGLPQALEAFNPQLNTAAMQAIAGQGQQARNAIAETSPMRGGQMASALNQSSSEQAMAQAALTFQAGQEARNNALRTIGPEAMGSQAMNTLLGQLAPQLDIYKTKGQLETAQGQLNQQAYGTQAGLSAAQGQQNQDAYRSLIQMVLGQGAQNQQAYGTQAQLSLGQGALNQDAFQSLIQAALGQGAQNQQAYGTQAQLSLGQGALNQDAFQSLIQAALGQGAQNQDAFRTLMQGTLGQGSQNQDAFRTLAQMFEGQQGRNTQLGLATLPWIEQGQLGLLNQTRDLSSDIMSLISQLYGGAEERGQNRALGLLGGSAFPNANALLSQGSQLAQLEQARRNANAQTAGGKKGGVGSILGTIVGMALGPAGAAAGGMLGSMFDGGGRAPFYGMTNVT